MVEVAEGVGDNSLRVDVLREHAYALGCVGRASEGMSVIADAICVGIDGVDPVTLGRALLVKTMFEAHLDHFERAASTAASAAILFSEAGDANRLLMARLYEGLVFVNRGDYREALNRFEGLDRNRLDVRSHASMLLAEAACHRSRNDVTRAERSFIACIEICDATQLLTLRRKAEWSFARLLMRNGSPARALAILRRLSDDFSELGLARESASVAVDVAEIFLALDRVAEARELALQALRYYKEEHLLAAASARAALALLSEAVKERKPTIEFIGDFRRLADERREVRLLTTVPVAIFGL
jgi:tetratricopeptide (TPR) repeat protein